MRRSGSEPTQARSPLRLRLGLALLGVVWGVAAAIGFGFADEPGWAAVFAVIGALAAIDAVLVIRRFRQGSRYQPGRDVPPFHPRSRQRDKHRR
jgi:hypothetical protein